MASDTEGSPVRSQTIRRDRGGATALIGKSVVVKGELEGSEDLTIEGQVEGKIELRDHTLTIGQGGRIKAQVFARAVVVCGELVGNINASETVEIREPGRSTATSCRRASPSPTARISAAASTCRRRARLRPRGAAIEAATPWKIPPSHGA